MWGITYKIYGMSIFTEIIKLLNLAEKTQPSELAKHVGILIDEMYVKEGLVYNKNSGALTGFVELGQ